MVMRGHGYSLIELMITLAIFGSLLVSAGNLTTNWIASSRVQDSVGVLTQGVSRAKAMALRNPGGVAGASAASILCIDGTTVRLFAANGSPPTAANCQSASAAWTAPLHASSAVNVAGSALSCLAFSNRGLPVNPASGSGTDNCALSSSIVVSSGSTSASVVLN